MKLQSCYQKPRQIVVQTASKGLRYSIKNHENIRPAIPSTSSFISRRSAAASLKYSPPDFLTPSAAAKSLASETRRLKSAGTKSSHIVETSSNCRGGCSNSGAVGDAER